MGPSQPKAAAYPLTIVLCLVQPPSLILLLYYAYTLSLSALPLLLPMHSSAFSLITILFSLLAPAMFAARDTFPYCNHTFSCGNLTNIYYPFSGGQRPDYCGLPGFQLTCVDNSTTLMTINSLEYRVLELNQLSQTLLLSREDLFNTTCTNLLINTTLNNTLFSSGANNEVVTLFYGCDDSVFPETIKPEHLFTCEINGKEDAYYLIGPLPRDPMLSQFQCGAAISVPIQSGFVDVLGSNRSLLSNVLKQGFNATYSNPFNEDCLKCFHSGGECGFNLSSGHSVCICLDDQPCPGMFIISVVKGAPTSGEVAYLGPAHFVIGLGPTSGTLFLR